MKLLIELNDEYSYILRVAVDKLRSLASEPIVTVSSHSAGGKHTYTVEFSGNASGVEYQTSGYLYSLKSAIPDLKFKFIGNEECL